jgi:3-phenylpropionate/trans-cinnamate dioxygenase ferredoxin reductase subunit
MSVRNHPANKPGGLFKTRQEVNMSHYKYLIIGAGMTADAAVRAIRKSDSHGSIGLVGTEFVPPYDRPPLTKDLWKGKALESIWRKTEQLDVTLHLGRVIQSLDPQNKRATDDAGDAYTFEKLLLATGGTPKQLPFGMDRIIYFRTIQDYQRLRALAEKKNRFAVIGGGFIGAELAAALAMNGKQVVMIFPDKAIGARMFPPELGLFLNEYFREKGVEIHPQESVTGVKVDGELLIVEMKNQPPIVVDGVVAGIGIQPNVELAEMAGLQVQNGIIVDEFLRTSQPDIYAAGDVAAFYSPVLEKRLRFEHEDNAKTMGKFAGHNMAGDPIPYHHQPLFYSDLFDLGYEAVGELDSTLDTVEDWQEPYRKGVVYYLKDKRVRGVLLWNVAHKIDAARKLIAEPGPFRPEDLKNKLSS